MNIDVAHTQDRDAICRLLSQTELPTQDLAGNTLNLFRVVREGDRIIGVVGLEHHGDVALLRSLSVDTHHRGKGFGSALAQAAESLAAELEISSLFLLTTTAADFFAGRGFSVVSREHVPEAIRNTTEFSSLCPSTASVMVKRIAHSIDASGVTA